MRTWRAVLGLSTVLIWARAAHALPSPRATTIHRPSCAPGPPRTRSSGKRIPALLFRLSLIVSAPFLVFPRLAEATPASAFVGASCGAAGNELGPLPCTTASDVANGSPSFPFPAAVAVGGSILGPGVGTGGTTSGGASATASAEAQIGSLSAAGAGTVPPFPVATDSNHEATRFSADAEFTDFFTATGPTHYTFTVFPDPVMSATNQSVANIDVSLSIFEPPSEPGLGGNGSTAVFQVECASGVSNFHGAPCSALHPPPLSLSWDEPTGGSFSLTADVNLSGSVVPDCLLEFGARGGGEGIVCAPSPTPAPGNASAADPLLVYLDLTGPGAGYTDASGFVYPTSPTSVPEPSTFSLVALALPFWALLYVRGRRTKKWSHYTSRTV
jgi:hypothetical protein